MRRITRRQALGSAIAIGVAGAGAGVAALALRQGSPEKARPSPSSTPSPAAGATPSPTPTPLPRRGGTARFAAPVGFNFDTFDAQRSGEPSLVELLGRTHSRLVHWADFAAPSLSGDLAGRWEQPDESTLVLHLDSRARWQDRWPLMGRSVTAQDCAASVQRSLQLARAGELPVSQRPWDYAGLSGVVATSASEVTIRTARPDPFLLQTLAGRFALVQAPEAVEAFGVRWHELAPDTVVGSGPFVFRGFDERGALVLDAHGAMHAPPVPNGLEISQPFDVVERFIDGKLDEALVRDRRDAARIRTGARQRFVELARFEDSPVISTFSVGAPPWNDPRLRMALSAALNRMELAMRLFGGRATAAGPVAPALPSFALPESVLARFAGYRPDLAEDSREARALWEAGGGPSLGPVIVDFPSVFDPLYSASSVVTGMLNDAIGTGQFRPAVESYPIISQKASEGAYGNGKARFWFGWGPALPGPDPARFLAENYASTSRGAAALGVRDDAVDRLLAKAVAEFDEAARRALIMEAQQALLAAGGGGVVDWVLQRSEVFRREDLGGRPQPAPFWDQHLDAQAYLDPAGAAG